MFKALEEAGFIPAVGESAKERVFEFKMPAKNDSSEAWVLVYTNATWSGRFTSDRRREIRVCAVRKKGNKRVKLVAMKEFNSICCVGSGEEIAQRVLATARLVYRRAARRENDRVRAGKE